VGRTDRLQRRRTIAKEFDPCVSVAGILLLAEATMTEIPEPTRERAMEPDRQM
jgi:chaperonin GroEL